MSKKEADRDSGNISENANNVLISLELHLYDAKGNEEIESLEQVQVDVTPNGNILIRSIISELMLRGYPMLRASVWYYSTIYSAFVFCDGDVLESTHVIEKEEYEETKPIVLQIQPEASLENGVTNVSKSKAKAKRKKKQQQKQIVKKSKDDERTIDTVLYQVKRWRQCYKGQWRLDHSKDSYILLEAAAAVGVKKKTLDDYLQLLKRGLKNGFDFNAEKEHKIGVLRKFVKSSQKESSSSPDCTANNTENQLSSQPNSNSN